VVGVRVTECCISLHLTLKAITHSMLVPKGLDCVLPIWFNQCGRVWFSHTVPRRCCALTVPFWKRHLKAKARHGTCELTWAFERQPVSDLPMFSFF